MQKDQATPYKFISKLRCYLRLTDMLMTMRGDVFQNSMSSLWHQRKKCSDETMKEKTRSVVVLGFANLHHDNIRTLQGQWSLLCHPRIPEEWSKTLCLLAPWSRTFQCARNRAERFCTISHLRCFVRFPWLHLEHTKRSIFICRLKIEGYTLPC